MSHDFSEIDFVKSNFPKLISQIQELLVDDSVLNINFYYCNENDMLLYFQIFLIRTYFH